MLVLAGAWVFPTVASAEQPSNGRAVYRQACAECHGPRLQGGVTADTVTDLRLAWVLSMRDGVNQTTPVVHDGVMFLANPGNVVQAIDAATGDVLWEIRLGHAAHGYTITYAIDGKQYVAVPTGLGQFRGPTASLTPEIFTPETGNALYVFALPD